MQTTHRSVRIPIIAEVDSVAGAVQAIRYPHRARFTLIVWSLLGNRFARWGRAHLIERRHAASPVGRLTLCGKVVPERPADGIRVGDDARRTAENCQYCFRHEAWR